MASDHELLPYRCIEDAADILAAATQARPIDVVIGDRIARVPLRARSVFASSLKITSQSRINARYWDFVEYYRLRTANALPHINYAALAVLLNRGLVSSVTTTNYDQYLQSISRRSEVFRFMMNPCLSPGDESWDNDGYYGRWPKNEVPPAAFKQASGTWLVPLWKIHGDLGYVRWSPCDHRFRLPDFAVSRPPLTDAQRKRFNKAGLYCLHTLPLAMDGALYAEVDATMRRNHDVLDAWHHTDFDSDRQIFEREGTAAQNALRAGAGTRSAILVIGLATQDANPEEIIPALVEAARQAPLIYVIPSESPVSPNSNLLLLELSKRGIPHQVINEVSEDGNLTLALPKLLTTIGALDAIAEYKGWLDSRKWWPLSAEEEGANG